MTRIIGILGKKYSGKDTVGRMICALRPSARTYAFASPMKEGLAVMLGLTHAQLHGDEKEVPIARFNQKTPRQLLQSLGTEWGQVHVMPTVWAQATMDRITTDAPPIAIITDVRFPHEAAAIRAHGGVIVRVVRAQLPRPALPLRWTPRGLWAWWTQPSGADHHVSETLLDKISADFVLNNDADLDACRDTVQEWVARHLQEAE